MSLPKMGAPLPMHGREGRHTGVPGRMLDARGCPCVLVRMIRQVAHDHEPGHLGCVPSAQVSRPVLVALRQGEDQRVG